MTLGPRVFVILTAMLATAACGGGSTAPVDAYPTAAHAPYPQLPDHGGPRLAHPQLVTVTFANDPRAPMLEAFAQWIVGSQWLAAVGADYGVGAGVVAGVAHRTETPPMTMTSGDIETYLAAGITDGSIPKPASPATLADALYIVYYPSTTNITTTFVNGIMKISCRDFGGYHGEVHASGLDFAYSAIPTCAGTVPGLTALETLEMIVSHEVIEAATDAMPISAPAFQLTPDPTDAWFTTFQFEVEAGDLCEDPVRYVREAGFVAQRSWSNNAAAAGGEPCIPIGPPPTPAFGATVAPLGTLHVAAGGTMDLTLTGWSDGAVADWQVVQETFGNPGAVAGRPQLTLDAATLNNGMTNTVHVTVPASANPGRQAAFLLVSSHTPQDASMWPIAVVVQ